MGLATFLLLLVLLLPGIVHYYASKKRTEAFLSASIGFVSVFFYFGLFSALARYLPIPFTPIVASTGFALLLLLIARISAVSDLNVTKRSRLWEVLSLAGILAASGCHWLIWNSSLKFGGIIPNHDVFNHTAWVGNIARYQSLAPSWAYSNPLTGAGMSSNLYPFSMHAFCAYIVELSHVQPSIVVIAFTKVLIIVFWPLGVFNLARAAGLKSFLGPVAAACSTVPLYNFPYTTLGWGGVAMVVGIVLLTHLVAISIACIPGKGIHLIAVVALSMFTLLVVHTSEAFIYPIMLAVLGAPLIIKHPNHRKIGGGIFFLCVFVFIFPWLDEWIGPGLISGLASVGVAGAGTMYQGVGQIVMISAGMEFHSIWVPVFLVAGFFAISFLPTRRNILHFYLIVVIGAFITSQVSFKPWTELSFAFSPWYRQYERMGYFVVPAVALLCGVAFELIETRRVEFLGKFNQVLKITIGTILLIAILGSSWGRTSRVFSILVSEHSPLSKDDLLAPSRVEKLKAIDTPILASFDSGIGYWANDYNMKVLGSPFLGSGLLTARESLLDTVSEIGTLESARDLLRKVNVSYVATNSRGMNGVIRPDPLIIEQSQNFDVFWKGDSVTVWKIRPVVSQLEGNFSTVFSTAEQPKMFWVLDKNVKLHVVNLDAVSREVEISFYVSQNTCNNSQSVSLWNGTKVELDNSLPSQLFGTDENIPVDNSGLVKLRVKLSANQELSQELKFNSKYCLFPETGAIIYGAMSPVSVKIIK